MSYTREQAEEFINDYRKSKFSFKEFLDHKFGQQFEVGKWYKRDERDAKVCYKGDKEGFGIWEGEWGKNWSAKSIHWQPMTDQEVHDFLKSECEKRYKVGDVVKNSCSFNVYEIQGMGVRVGHTALFLNRAPVLDLSTGEWAEVIKKDPIAEQIEKLEKELQTLKSKYNEQNK
jgi:hypothetical protein